MTPEIISHPWPPIESDDSLIEFIAHNIGEESEYLSVPEVFSRERRNPLELILNQSVRLSSAPKSSNHLSRGKLAIFQKRSSGFAFRFNGVNYLGQADDRPSRLRQNTFHILGHPT